MAIYQWMIKLSSETITPGMWYGFRTVPTYSAAGAGYYIPVFVRSFGAGMPPIKNVSIPYALLGGSNFQRSVPQSRVMILELLMNGSEWLNMLKERQNLIDVVKPDRTAEQELITLRLQTDADMIEIEGVLDGGLDLQSVDGFTEHAMVRFLCPDPFFRSTADTVQSPAPGVRVSVANCNYIAQRSVTGMWGALGTGTNGLVGAMARAADGTLYVGGEFTTAGGVAVNYVAKWDGAAWTALGAGMDGFVMSLAIGPDGTLYACGNFANAGGVATGTVAKWDGAAWSALGPGGVTGACNALTIGTDGCLYAAGLLTNAGGVAVNRIAKWDGAAWSALGSGLNNSAHSIAKGMDGSIYVGGDFTTAGGGGAVRIARWNGAAWSALGSGMDNRVQALAVGLDGIVYAGGLFTTAGGTSIRGVAQWDGVSWSPLGSGINNDTYSLALDDDGSLWVGGNFGTAGGVSLVDRLAHWTGSGWALPDINLPGTAVVYDINVWQGVLTLGYDTAGAATTAAVTTVINGGKADTFPVLTVSGPGRIYQMVNFATNEAIFFNLTLVAGETVTLDLSRMVHAGPEGKETTGQTFMSTFRGNVIGSILPGSKTGRWHLMPGNNPISLFVDDAAATATLKWRKRYWSIDGVGV